MSVSEVESPFSNYSYPSDLTLSTPQPESQHSPRNASNADRLPHPRPHRTPDLFRDVFGVERNNRFSPPTHHLNYPPLNYQETMNDVNRALQSANRAIQNAQEAFQSRRSLSHEIQTRQEVVDLTGNSPPIATAAATTLPASHRAVVDDTAYTSIISRFLHPHDVGNRPSVTNTLLNEPFYGVLEDDPTARYTGADSLSGPRRRFELQQRPYLGASNMQHVPGRTSEERINTREEQAAIHRQRIARVRWEENQRRTNERQRLEAQRQRLLNSPTAARNTLPSSVNRPEPNPARPVLLQVDSSSSIEAVDLTEVENDLSLAAALSKQRQEAVALQNHSQENNPSSGDLGSGPGRSALTAYKCPICMEAPQNATTTSCGHLFCHKCIIDTLKYSEQVRRDEAPPSRKVKGVCPVCRKELARKEEPGNGRTLIPLELKLITKKELKRKHQEEELRRIAQSKGKEKVYDVEEEVDQALQAEIAKYIESYEGDANQKENRNAKRIKTTSSADGDHAAVDDTILDDLFGYTLNEDYS